MFTVKNHFLKQATANHRSFVVTPHAVFALSCEVTNLAEQV
jgi:hypothetical protein